MRRNLLMKSATVVLIAIVGCVIGIAQGFGRLGQSAAADAKASAKTQPEPTPSKKQKRKEVDDRGSMPNMGGSPMLSGVVDESIAWKRPEGDPPAWLTAAKRSSEAAERLRATLNETIEVDVTDVVLAEALKNLFDQQPIECDINIDKILAENDQVLEAPLSLTAKAPLRNVLRRLLKPRELGYIVHDSFIEITTKDDSKERPTMRCYDLVFVVDESRPLGLGGLIQSIEQSVSPDDWVNAGGASSLELVGSLLVATTTDPAHQQIEALLYKLSQTNPR